MLRKMHSIEHEADGKRHEMAAALAKVFVTPLDREDLAQISHDIDEVADCIEEVMQRFYVDRIETVLPDAIAFAERIVESCKLMKATLGVRDHTADVLTILSWREIFDKLEACADACEHVGDCIETIVMKNT